MARWMTVLVAVAAIAAFAGGCGDDDGDASAGSGSDANSETSVPEVETSSLSKPQFVKEANARCRLEKKDLVKELTDYLNARRGQDGPELYADMIRAVFVPIVERELEMIAELGAPEGDEETIEALLTAEREALDEVAALERVQSLPHVQSFFVDADKLVQGYGIVGCSNGPAF